MQAAAGLEYELSLHDLDFAGDRSYVYRLNLTAAPQVLAAYPAAGQRGETRAVEFVGLGLATGADQLESITRSVTFAVAGDVPFIDFPVETPWGNTKLVRLMLTDIPEAVEGTAADQVLQVPGAVTGAIDSRFGSDQYSVSLQQGQTWEVLAQARSIGSVKLMWN